MFRVRCECGRNGVVKLSKECEVIIIVDVLSFSTSVDIAVGRSIQVIPYGGSLDIAPEFAVEHDALLSQHRGRGGFSLSPASFLEMPYVERVVLPSPNGSTLTLLAGASSQVLYGCLRNASAVGKASHGYQTVGVVPAGERWSDGSMRPALEDWLGAGAIIANLPGSWFPEAQAAVAAFETHRADILGAMRTCPSGVELIDKGYEEDVVLASQYDVSGFAARFNPPAYFR